MEDVSFYTHNSLRVVFDIFKIIFHFCYLKINFWVVFPQKYPSYSQLHHMRMAQLQTSKFNTYVYFVKM